LALAEDEERGGRGGAEGSRGVGREELGDESALADEVALGADERVGERRAVHAAHDADVVLGKKQFYVR
jgi:hypothetical protein